MSENQNYRSHQCLLTPPQPAILNLTSKQNPRSSYRRNVSKGIRVYSVLQTGTENNKLGPLSCSTDGPWHRKPTLILVSTLCNSFLSVSTCKYWRLIHLQYDLFDLKASIVCTVKDTWSVKGKFDGRSSRSSLALGELQLIIFLKSASFFLRNVVPLNQFMFSFKNQVS